jgi:hypothetical protein
MEERDWDTLADYYVRDTPEPLDAEGEEFLIRRGFFPGRPVDERAEPAA